MKNLDIGQTVNSLANLGVIVGIVFLAIEIQQNYEFAEESVRAERYEAALSAYELVLDRSTFQNNPLLREVWREARGLFDPDFVRFMEQEIIVEATGE